MPDDKRIDRLGEEAKLAHDYLKHLTTLSTGSLVLIVGFVEKVAQPKGKWIVGIALVSFLLCIIGSVVAMTANLETMHREEDVAFHRTGAIALLLAWFSFLTAVICLAVFGLKNL
jgi:hypothetical protein